MTPRCLSTWIAQTAPAVQIQSGQRWIWWPRRVELGHDRLGDAAFDGEPAGVVVERREGRRIAVARETRGLDRRTACPGQRRNGSSSTCSIAWVCTSPPGVPNGMNSVATLDRQCRVGRQPRPLARRDAGRVARVGPRLRAAVRRDQPGPRHHRRAVGAVARRRREDVAPAVGDADIGGVGLGVRVRPRLARSGRWCGRCRRPARPAAASRARRWSGRISFRRSAAYSAEISVGSGTSTIAGSP